jgi:hypothetical protein
MPLDISALGWTPREKSEPAQSGGAVRSDEDPRGSSSVPTYWAPRLPLQSIQSTLPRLCRKCKIY